MLTQLKDKPFNRPRRRGEYHSALIAWKVSRWIRWSDLWKYISKSEISIAVFSDTFANKQTRLWLFSATFFARLDSIRLTCTERTKLSYKLRTTWIMATAWYLIFPFFLVLSSWISFVFRFHGSRFCYVLMVSKNSESSWNSLINWSLEHIFDTFHDGIGSYRRTHAFLLFSEREVWTLFFF